MGRGKTATDDAVRRCIEENIDILLIQEPYAHNRKLKISGMRVYYDMSGREDVWSAILVINDKIGVVMGAVETNGTCVSIRVEHEGKSM